MSHYRQEISFKDMCARFGVTPRTLRYYDSIELLHPKRIGRSRFYGPRECARLTLILRGRRFGFKLEEIRQWLMIYDQQGRAAQRRAWIALADRRLDELKAERDIIDRNIQDLAKLRDEAASHSGD